MDHPEPLPTPTLDEIEAGMAALAPHMEQLCCELDEQQKVGPDFLYVTFNA